MDCDARIILSDKEHNKTIAEKIDKDMSIVLKNDHEGKTFRIIIGLGYCISLNY
jgi:hypothetical protein